MKFYITYYNPKQWNGLRAIAVQHYCDVPALRMELTSRGYVIFSTKLR